MNYPEDNQSSKYVLFVFISIKISFVIVFASTQTKVRVFQFWELQPDKMYRYILESMGIHSFAFLCGEYWKLMCALITQNMWYRYMYFAQFNRHKVNNVSTVEYDKLIWGNYCFNRWALFYRWDHRFWILVILCIVSR